jgi:opacity protein-like surface antigen
LLSPRGMRPLALVMATALLAPATARADDDDGDLESRWELAGAAGVSAADSMPGFQSVAEGDELEPTALFSLRYRLTDRVLWSVPTLGFAYLGGAAGEREWIPWGGLVSWGLGYSSVEGLIAEGQLGAGLDVREWLGERTAVNLTAGAVSRFRYASDCVESICGSSRWVRPERWRGVLTAGVSQRIGSSFTVNLGAGASRTVDVGDPMTSAENRSSVFVGSVQTIALRRLPLIQAHVSSRWSVDGYASLAFELDSDRVQQSYLLGATWIW